ncbi:hypothetical protein L208DRAFT_1411365, partial [Tricholoma matsutake]
VAVVVWFPSSCPLPMVLCLPVVAPVLPSSSHFLIITFLVPGLGAPRRRHPWSWSW